MMLIIYMLIFLLYKNQKLQSLKEFLRTTLLLRHDSLKIMWQLTYSLLNFYDILVKLIFILWCKWLINQKRIYFNLILSFILKSTTTLNY